MTTYFSWVQAGEEFDSIEHGKNDLDIISLNIQHREGAIAQAVLHIATQPHIIFKKWAYISVADDQHNIKPIFFGQLVRIPEHLNTGETRLVFSALPTDVSEKIALLSAQLKQKPYWDELFIDPSALDNAAELLEARPAFFHFDRITHHVILSNLFDGRIVHTIQYEVLQDSLSFKIQDLPQPYIDVTLSAEWTQIAQGEINIFPAIAQRFSGGIVNTLTPQSFVLSWPEGGKSLRRSGYVIAHSSLKEITPPKTGILNLYPTLTTSFLSKNEQGQILPKRLRRHWYKGQLILSWHYQQKRQEIVEFRLNHAHQLAPLNPFDGKKLSLTLQAVDRSENPVIGDLARASFFQTDRGREAIEHAIQIAKCHLAARARCIVAAFSVPMDVGMQFSPADSIQLIHDLIPEGSATGKIIEVSIIQSSHQGIAQLKVAFSAGCLEQNQENQDRDDQIPSMDDHLYVAADYCAGELIKDSQWQLVPQVKIQEGDIQGITNPYHLDIHDFMQSIQIRHDGGAQSLFLQSQQYPVQDNVVAALQHRPTEVVVDLLNLKTSETLVQHYVVADIPDFCPPCQLKMPITHVNNEDERRGGKIEL